MHALRPTNPHLPLAVPAGALAPARAEGGARRGAPVLPDILPTAVARMAPGCEATRREARSLRFEQHLRQWTPPAPLRAAHALPRRLAR